MNVLVLGGYGLIGDAVIGRLLRDGHHVTGLGRDVRDAGRRRPAVRWIAADMSKLLAAEDWLPVVAGMDAVVKFGSAIWRGRRPSKTHRCPPKRNACFASGLLAVFQPLARRLRSSGRW
ncbi:NAD-dependent epimerase/dehydratase family protein [Mesorhizobium japonicum]|uniref:NAD-dependent epimerase/dehydratase domain-containing protein n=1 Tax=Rhizobium loti TaxID=381 RepID=A0A1A5IYP5_RHILI|nr:hypothetical protein BAE42_21170 [Mesorhizobium loti]OBP72928.1 hypothetical protein BAE39_20615 [Mesorhizobium loti]OBP84245.1 hypothetical protein BAE41_28755 [Mesorhizobium loti]OBP87724.1 hypothetical protein BAE40_24390 [Mesorhizobium loti]OBP97263.1 hypothetical protein BAE38_25500 [Mesorhizobium loti]